jgi:hypothetical protein
LFQITPSTQPISLLGFAYETMSNNEYFNLDLRQENGQDRQFVANHSTSRNKLKKKTADYLESADNPLNFALRFLIHFCIS